MFMSHQRGTSRCTLLSDGNLMNKQETGSGVSDENGFYQPEGKYEKPLPNMTVWQEYDRIRNCHRSLKKITVELPDVIILVRGYLFQD